MKGVTYVRRGQSDPRAARRARHSRPAPQRVFRSRAATPIKLGIPNTMFVRFPFGALSIDVEHPLKV
jgi:hypothetical protein